MNKKALVLAGGYPQIALINELKKRGIYTILADYYENPVAKPYADVFFRISTLDVEAIKKLAETQKVDFLITACTDQALLTVACVSEALGLPCYIDYQTALNVTNKQYMKEVFVKNNIPTAKHVTMAELDVSLIQEMEYPLIVKPVDCNSSKGVKRVENIEELQIAFHKAVKLSRTQTAIIEEFIDGEELSVDLYVENGVPHILSISISDKIAERDKFVIFRGRYAKDTAEKVHELVRSVAQQITEAFNLKNTPMLIQMITDGKRVSVLEFSARTGGSVKYILINKTSGFDVISAVVDLTLGIQPHVGEVITENNYIVNEFIYCKPGVFDHLEGFEELKEDGIITDYYLFKWCGARFDTIENSGDRIAGFTIQADTIEEMNKKHAETVKRIRVIDNHGMDMTRRDLLTDLKF